jgi:hypothetical protein
MDVEVIAVIRTRLLRKGEGVPDDPIRIIEQYWSFDGTLLWQSDPCDGPISRLVSTLP